MHWTKVQQCAKFIWATRIKWWGGGGGGEEEEANHSLWEKFSLMVVCSILVHLPIVCLPLTLFSIEFCKKKNRKKELRRWYTLLSHKIYIKVYYFHSIIIA